MIRFLTRRLLLLIPILLGVSILTFSLILLIPGDPVTLMLGPNASPESIEALRAALHLDDNVVSRYLAWLSGALTGDFGISISTRERALDVALRAVKNTAILAVAALSVAIVAGVIGGVVSAASTRWRARLVDAGLVSGMSIPSFMVALVLLYVFALKLHIFPTGGMGPVGQGFDPKYLVLPALAVAVLPFAFISRLSSTLIRELESADFVLALRARAFSGPRVWRHLVRNAAPGMANIIGLQAGTVLAGALYVEIVFSWPGIGTAIVRAIESRDYPVIQTIVLITGILFTLTTIVTDATMRALDPRMDIQ